MIKICETAQFVRDSKPLIHCITNPISINWCANAILALGARPIMAEHPEEVEEITQTADALMLNLGNITDARMKSILISAKIAKKKGIPVILDAVGIACSLLRRKYTVEFLKEVIPNAIKGNYSEIKALYSESYRSVGVDADCTLETDDIKNIVLVLAKKYNTVILATGKEDIISDGTRVYICKNGCGQLSEVTGSGCILGAICSSFMSVNNSVEAVVASAVYFGICGELSKNERGSGTYMINLIDNLSNIKIDDIEKLIDVEVNEID